ncbi:MAG: LysM peptidoglycan-binding domain-containing protein [Phycisphaerales bacterium JB039]
MRGNHTRLGAGLGALAVLWIAVYWWWDPSGEPPIRFDTGETGPADPGPAPVDPAPPTRDPPPTAAEAPAEPAGVLPPDSWAYIVQRDDETLESIAEEYLGDSADWVIIAQMNPLKDPARISAGDTWYIPLDKGNLQGQLVDAEGRPVAPQREPAPPPAPEDFIEYVVQPGDSLSVISQRLYGTQKHAQMLYELNRQRLGLRSIDAISVGQVIHAPKTP